MDERERKRLLQRIRELRVELTDLDMEIAQFLAEARDAADLVQVLVREFPPGAARVVDAEQRLDSARERAQLDQNQRREVIRQLGELLTDLANLSPDLTAEIAQLDVSAPIVLLPVRFETRFSQLRSRSQLLVRIYPDRIHADSHEPALTHDEQAAGAAYWSAAAVGGESLGEWQKLIAQYSSTRAAWIVAATDPSGLNVTQSRPAPWSRAVEARLLPDRWLVIGYRAGTEVLRAVSSPIVEPLALTVSPTAPDDQLVDLSGDGLLVDDGVLWAYDFDRAVDVGMGLRIDIALEDLDAGFDLLIVLGIKASMDPDESARALASLFAAQRFTEGLAFVPPGTPTNNTVAAPSGYPPDDHNGAVSFAAERTPPPLDPSTYGSLFDTSLGFGPVTVPPVWDIARIHGSARSDVARTHAMSNALWPATIGYFLDQMLDPDFPRDSVDETREWVVEHVRGGGHLPTMRVGQTPYGLLPVVSLQSWVASDRDGRVDEQVATLAHNVRPTWLDASAQVPRVGRSDDPDRDLLGLLAMDASAREVRVRPSIGEYTHHNLLNFFGTRRFGLDWIDWIDARDRRRDQVLGRIGLSHWDPRGGKMLFSFEHFRYGGPLVEAHPLSEDRPLSFNYIDWLLNGGGSNPVLLLNLEEAFPNQDDMPDALLFYLLRHALMLEINRSAMQASLAHGAINVSNLREAELIQLVDGTENDPTIWDRLASPLPFTGGEQLGTWLLNTPGEPETQWIDRVRESLNVLVPLPTAELDRLFGETMDVCSHRLDAWISALAARRLSEMRVNRPEGSYVGAYGWVESLRPTPPDLITESRLPDGRWTRTVATNGGYIHAPSSNHASTAAVLRSAYLSRGGETTGQFAVNLSSERVRTARELLDKLRIGQPLGAVLGYQIERGLHNRGLDIYIEMFRQRYPLVADKGSDSGEPAEQIAARNVVDGLLFHEAWRRNNVPWDAMDSTLVDVRGPRAEIEEELRQIDRALDATGDLLSAESVYQALRGNTSAAGSSFDALAGGGRPPDPEIAQAARGGTPLTHRVALVFGETPLEPPGGWKQRGSPGDRWVETPRALAEPQLAGWVGELIGNPSHVMASVTYYRETSSGEPQPGLLYVRLVDLGLSPLDVLSLADEATAATELDLRVADFVYGLQPDAMALTIDYSRDALTNPQTMRTFPDILELARAIRAVLGGGRPLRPEDFVPPEHAAGSAPPIGDGSDEETRALAALTQLKDTISSLETANSAINRELPDPNLLLELRKQLRLAGHFVTAGAYPTPQALTPSGQEAELFDRTDSILRELHKRRDEADAEEFPTDYSGRIATATTVAQIVFGRDFILLPAFGAPAENELQLALDAGPSLAGLPRDIREPDEIREWFQRAARVQPGLARWRALSLYTYALSTPNIPLTTFQLAQLPHDPSITRWAALPFSNEAHRPPPGRISLLCHRPNPSQPGSLWSGLLLDSWTEYIPYQSEQTAIAYHYDMPSAEAPQAILLAVPPDPRGGWEVDTLVATVLETLELAKIRSVDGDLLPELAQLLPAIYLSANTARETVDTDFSGKLIAEPVIVP